MRPALVASLILIGVFALAVRNDYIHHHGRRNVHTVPASEFKSRVIKVYGWGETDTDAKQEALQKAQIELVSYLRSLDPPLEWEPPLSYIDQHLAKLSKPDPPERDLGVGQPVSRWQIKVELTPRDRSDIQQQDREYRSQQRMLWLAKVLGGLVACFAAVAGYVHLDERTKGYYTNWLRLAAIGFVGAVGAGLWYLP
jgi:hypothetical protein